MEDENPAANVLHMTSSRKQRVNAHLMGIKDMEKARMQTAGILEDSEDEEDELGELEDALMS